MAEMLLRWLASTVAVLVTAALLPGVRVDGFWPAVGVALVLGLANAFLRPLLLVLTLPINLLTLGLLTFAINALMVLLTAWLVPGFEVKGFWWALLFSLVLSVVNFVLNRVRPGGGGRATPDVVP